MDRAPAETSDDTLPTSGVPVLPGARRPIDDEPDGWLESDPVEERDEPVAPQGARTPDDGLTDREREILAFERQWWRHAGAKEQAIRDLFQVSSTRYYQLLNGLLDKPAALAYDPILVARLRRLRATRARARGRTNR